MKLYELAQMVRCKNAGPFALTIDILFGDRESYEKTLATGVLTPKLISELYDIPLEKVQYFECTGANAIKFSFPRKAFCGDFEDGDVYGCQHHAPLVELEIPV
ncbi:MAG: DUF4387 domain-containing protein [Oscillospiraceae bacterium]|nr:DUF4387 domain-containing protein [Oscillospiraceae bacterium]